MSVTEVHRRALRSLIPPPRLELADWIERNVVLPQGTSAVPGRMRLWPYQRAIADAIGDPLIERVTLVKAARTGFTSLLTAAIGAFAVNEPSPVLCLLPTESDCRDYVVSDVEPIFAASPVLRGVLAEEADEFGRNTLLSRRFPGGSLKVVAARAPRNLRRHTVRVLLVDECDAMQPTPEGAPILLAERRTVTFGNRKIVIGSTPIDAEASPVLASYAASDSRLFEVPCPECGAFSEITWAHIEWPEGRPHEAAYRCPHCKTLIAERRKPAMVAAGRWRATHPDAQGHAGFRLNALVSLLANASWSRLAAEFVAAKDDPERLQPFVNTVLAEGWRGPGGELDEATLQSRAEPFDLNHMPSEVLAVTVGADVQDDRIEASVLGWTRASECLILGHFIVWGSFTEAATWDEFDELLRTKWRHPFGGQLKVDAAVIDCGDGDHYDHVVSFCAPRIGRRVFPGKGMYGNRPGFAMAKGKRVGGKLAIIGVDVLKSVIFDRLARGQGIRFSNSLEPSYYEQLSAQRRVLKYTRGMPTRRFEMVSMRARKEALDALTYGWAARQAVNIVYDRREDDLRNPTAKRPSITSQIAGHGGSVSIDSRDHVLRTMRGATK